MDQQRPCEGPGWLESQMLAGLEVLTLFPSGQTSGRRWLNVIRLLAYGEDSQSPAPSWIPSFQEWNLLG